MKDLDFIRYLIDLVDQHNTNNSEEKPVEETSEDGDVAQSHHYADNFVSVVGNEFDGKKKDNDDNDDDVNPTEIKNSLDSEDIYIPPLQQRIEMLKKLTGVNPKDREILSHIDGDDPTAS